MRLSSSNKAPNMWRDMRRDWRSWSRIERVAAGALGLATLASAAFYTLAGAIG